MIYAHSRIIHAGGTIYVLQSSREDMHRNRDCLELVLQMFRQEVKSSVPSRRNSTVVAKAVSGKLKAFYDEIAAQEIPDRLKELLERIDKPADHLAS